MDPRFNNNYGTFVIPPGCGEVEMWREDVEMDLQGSELPHPVRVVERAVLTETIEYHMQRRRNRGFGFRLCSEGSNVTISDIGDEVGNVSFGVAYDEAIVNTRCCPPSLTKKFGCVSHSHPPPYMRKRST